jgi:hypothetical protein
MQKTYRCALLLLSLGLVVLVAAPSSVCCLLLAGDLGGVG